MICQMLNGKLIQKFYGNMKNLLNWKNIIKLIIIIGLVRAIFFFVSNFESAHEVCLQKETEWRAKKLNGKLIAKYIDSTQHNYKTALFIEGNDSVRWILDWDESKLFTILTIGDSIVKRKGQLKIQLFREKRLIHHKINLKCDSYR